MTKSPRDLRYDPIVSTFARHERAVRGVVMSLASTTRFMTSMPQRTIQPGSVSRRCRTVALTCRVMGKAETGRAGRGLVVLSSLFVILLATVACGDESVAAHAKQIEFFETKIRPLLVNRCYECHSGISRSLQAGLRLDSIAAILKGGDSGPAIVPGKPEESLLIESIRYESNEMPPYGKLNDKEIAALTKWVELGAPWSNKVATPIQSKETVYDWEIAREHWAWQPLRKVEPPAAQNHERTRNPIDQFVAAGLRGTGLKQPGTATAPVFVRRVFFDLVGMPPTPDELKDWVGRLGEGAGSELNDSAVSQLVNTLLGRPQYGERWGRHWLDVARYSDTGGWTQDNRSRPMAWHYRDWVIKAFNTDMPYNEFVRRQIVGDEIDRESAIATGFFALGPTYASDGGDPESIAQAKSETLDDRVDTFSRAFLGLTVSCARCHDHKFDPIPTQDYYSIAGVFNNTQEGETPLVDGHVIRDFHDHQRPINQLRDKISKTRRKAIQEKRKVSEEEQDQIEKWQKEADELNAKSPPKYDFAHTIHDSSSDDMRVALRGNLLKPGQVAPRRFLRIVSGEDREKFTEGSGREQLADAVVDHNNPLTARVFVNRVWLNHFDRALVRTPNNFGMLGEKPTHPELLDWLAATFIESAWSIKSLHRLIMTSATYRSSSKFDETAFATDGDNRSVWRMNPRRMDVETWRDSLLAVTGEMDTTIGGPSVDNIVRSNRRTLYAKVSRNNPLDSDEFLRLFDFPIPRASSAKRTSNVVPQQFLFMMNSQFMLDRARMFANRLHKEHVEVKPQIEQAYALLYGRKPTAREIQVATRYLVWETPLGSQTDRWQQYCQVLLSTNEFMFIR